MTSENGIKIRSLKKNEGLPYELLLLADETLDAIDKYIHDCEISVCESDHKIIAACATKILTIYCAEIKNIAVDVAFQGNGIGRHLLKNTAESFKKRGFKFLLIGTGDNSSKQIPLYQKLGFEKFEVRINFFVENYPEAIYENGQQLKDMIVLKKEL